MVMLLATVVLPIACIVAALVAAARRGHTMPMKVCIILICIGAGLVVAPTILSFLLQLFGREPHIAEAERQACWIAGAIALFAGLVESILASSGKDASSQ